MLKVHYTRFYREVANLLRICCGLVSDTTGNNSVTSWQQVVVVEFGKRHDTTDTTDFCPRQFVTDWCNGFGPLPSQKMPKNKMSSDKGWTPIDK